MKRPTLIAVLAASLTATAPFATAQDMFEQFGRQSEWVNGQVRLEASAGQRSRSAFHNSIDRRCAKEFTIKRAMSYQKELEVCANMVDDALDQLKL